jgi:hypothetical protein
MQKLRAAIVGLVRGHSTLDGYRNLRRRNSLASKNVLRDSAYPMLIFHEGNISHEHQAVMKREVPSLEFIDVGPTAFAERPSANVQDAQLGYKHMCRFYAIGIYDHVGEYDYIMRLDDDSFVMSRLPFDIFEFMAINDLDYGYVHEERDSHPGTLATLPEFSRDYIRTQGISPRCQLSDLDDLHLYSNCHVTRVGFWLRPDVQGYLNAVDDSGGIYLYRWGDHIIQTHALKIFSEARRLHRFDDFRYFHHSHRWSNYERGRIERLRESIGQEVRRTRRRFLRRLRV